jgi:hypothetical protein
MARRLLLDDNELLREMLSLTPTAAGLLPPPPGPPGFPS